MAECGHHDDCMARECQTLMKVAFHGRPVAGWTRWQVVSEICQSDSSVRLEMLDKRGIAPIKVVTGEHWTGSPNKSPTN